MNPREYNYLDAGFDGFLSRSVDNLDQTNLDSQGPQSTQMRFDSAQLSGSFGDTLTIGKIRLENTRIVVNDGNNDFFLVGPPDG